MPCGGLFHSCHSIVPMGIVAEDKRKREAKEEWCDGLVSLPSALQLDVQRREGLHPDQIVHHPGSVGVVGAIMEPVDGAGWVLETFIPG